MDESLRQPTKLQKRKSRERQDLAMSGALSGQTANTSQPLAPSTNTMSTGTDKKSKWRVANPFHSKEKDKPRDRKDVRESNADSAYFSSEPNTSANPSFASNARPISGEQWHPPATSQPATERRPSTPPVQESLAPPPRNLNHSSSRENISQETHRDAGTGNIVTVTTTTTTTTVTTTGPGGSITTEQPVGSSNSQPSVTSRSGPSPPSPAPPLPASQYPVPGLPNQGSIPEEPATSMPTNYQQGLAPPTQTHNAEGSSPPIPPKNNIRHRMELDSVSPAIQRPNPMDAPISPVTPSSPTRANFSYPARIPPLGNPRQVPSQHLPIDQQHGGSGSSQPPYDYNDPSHPVPYRAGHAPQQPQDQQQRVSTIANLKAAAAGIHGAGETLRGTFNDTFDRRFAAPDSAVHAKNKATIDAGRYEIEHAQFQHRQGPAAPGASPLEPTQTSYQGPPISGSQVEGGRTGKLNSFMKKMKEVPLASNRDGAGQAHP